MNDDEKRVHDEKCISCAKLFECSGHPEEVKECVCYEERKDERNR